MSVFKKKPGQVVKTEKKEEEVVKEECPFCGTGFKNLKNHKCKLDPANAVVNTPKYPETPPIPTAKIVYLLSRALKYKMVWNNTAFGQEIYEVLKVLDLDTAEKDKKYLWAKFKIKVVD